MRTPSFFSVISLFALLLLAACTDPFSHGGGANRQVVDSAQSAKSVSYSAVAPLIQTYCVRCHAGFATYGGLSKPEEMFDVLFKSHTMPKAGSPQPSASEMQMLQNWLAAGAPDNSASGEPAEPMPEPTATPEPGASATYTQAAAVIGQYCVMCHAKFSTYAGVKANLDDISDEVFDAKEMPPSSKPQPTAEQLTILKSWIDAGGLPDGSVAPTPTPAPTPAQSATYSQASVILKTYCTTCHAGLTTFSIVKASLGDIQKMVFQTQVMPPSTKPQPSVGELATLKSWIDAGALPDASVTPTPTPVNDPTVLPAKWSYISANIINAKCIKCHTATSKHGSLANYNDLFATGAGKVVRNQPENSPLFEVLDGAKVVMPPLMTGVTVTPAERTAIHDWIANGAVNDLLPQ